MTKIAKLTILLSVFLGTWAVAKKPEYPLLQSKEGGFVQTPDIQTLNSVGLDATDPENSYFLSDSATFMVTNQTPAEVMGKLQNAKLPKTLFRDLKTAKIENDQLAIVREVDATLANFELQFAGRLAASGDNQIVFYCSEYNLAFRESSTLITLDETEDGTLVRFNQYWIAKKDTIDFIVKIPFVDMETVQNIFRKIVFADANHLATVLNQKKPESIGSPSVKAAQ